MRIAKAFAAALVLMAAAAGTAAAQDEVEYGTFHSHLYYDMGTGMLYTWSEYESWMRAAGFSNVTRHRLLRDHGSIVGRKP